jgi:AcrR family transcriptional regulator
MKKKSSRARIYDPDRVKRDIIAVATAEFAESGYNGARVDEIAARTRTSKRMLYYYFKGKEGLFVAVLEEAYSRIRRIERELDLKGLSPVEALRRLVEFTFDYHCRNPDFVRLVAVENIHNAIHLRRSAKIQKLNASALEVVEGIYRRGVKAGAFRAGLETVDLHMTISALCFFNVSNRATFSRVFRKDMATARALARRRKVVGDTVVRYALKP